MKIGKNPTKIEFILLLSGLLLVFLFASSVANAAAKTITDPLTGIKFVQVNEGCYRMGDLFDDGYSTEKPVHEVCVDDFYMAQYEVTQAQWQKIMGTNPSSFKGNNRPVEQVSWDDIQDFIRKLRQQSGKHYRLPTEAEWEYAARSGGKKEKYAGGSGVNAVAWYSNNSHKKTHSVGQKSANGLGLYDMSGNVWEWCVDGFSEKYYSQSPRNNPQGAADDLDRVSRGGGWFSDSRGVRTARRNINKRNTRSDTIGFRLIYKPDQSKGNKPLPIKPLEFNAANAHWQFNQSKQLAYVNGTYHYFAIQYLENQVDFTLFLGSNSPFSRIGDITVDGKTLSAYSNCQDGITSNCHIDGNNKNIFIVTADLKSIEQLNHGSKLRATVQTEDDSEYILNVPLTGSKAAIQKAKRDWIKKGTNDLVLAVLHRDRKMVKKHLASGKFNINAADAQGRTPLSIVNPYQESATEDDKYFMRLLVKHGADINDRRLGSSLAEVAENGTVDDVRFLLELGANPNGKDYNGDPAIVNCLHNDKFEKIYSILIAAGADKYATDHDGVTILHNALQWSEASTKFLIKKRFNVNRKDKFGRTPILYAFTDKYISSDFSGFIPDKVEYETIRELLKHGAIINKSAIKKQLKQQIARGKYTTNAKNNLSKLERLGQYYIYLKNKTSETIRVALRYKNIKGKWTTDSWFKIPPGNQNLVAKTANSYIYYYAYCDSGVWRGDDNYYHVQGHSKKKGFREKKVPKNKKGGSYTLTFND